ncbi:MAG TPA: hypothetical protein VNY25_10260 [Steroidobacteraceae bacterium]|nr:hypothetical protein [Steroidobacteraceae bacterium]
MRMQIWSCRALLGTGLLLLSNSLAWGAPPHAEFFQCDEPNGILCAEQRSNPGGTKYYVGHDEPSLLFYSNERGSGYNNVYRIRLPKDPPLLPKQDGSGGTWNFQLHPAFWFGMAMCDDQGTPNPGGSPGRPNIPCTPDSDSNIFDSPDPAAPDYIGNHPGTAFMEMQFYPPGWLTSNSATQWTAALNIDSFQSNDNTGQVNNPVCSNITHDEYVNFAFIQTDGVPFPPGSPSPLGPLVSTNANTLYMDPGDELIVTLADTEHGFKVTIKDLTTGQTGFMVASGANGFASVRWDPNGTNCDFATHNLAHDFHPTYATSSEHTRVPGAAHTYNIAFSDEIGHFEYCNSVDKEGGNCTSTAANDPPGLDDAFCFDAAFAAQFGLIPIGGCIDGDADFDGVPYRKTVWPGTFRNPFLDALFHTQPVIFSSPLFTDRKGHKKNFSRVAFETDMPRIEFATNPPCQRHLSNPADPNPGAGCVNPPVGADFYPIFTTRQDHEEGDHETCQWQEGGRFLPGTSNDFGGNSKAEYGPILANFYPAPNGHPQYIYENFHRTLPFNPCPTFIEGDE